MNDCVSVITPSFNSSAFIKHCIGSVLSQTYSSWEMIIVDDGSTDNSVDIIRTLAVGDSRVKLLRLETNGGPAIARNAGIRAARGRFIAFLDSDDLWCPEKLERQIRFMREGGHLLTYSYYERITQAGVPTGDVVRPPMSLTYRDMLKSNQIGCLTAVYDRAALGTQLMPLIRKRQDYGLWLRILRQIPRAYCLPESLAFYRLRSSSLSSDKLALIKYHWHLFRREEKLPLATAAYCVGCNIAKKLLG